ncbi:hypothetical protein [Streptomyces sp. SID13031]|uniref:hypothetical protein n=1 Tax=Streptomyces sp. SID13031 TaxID=2706046 RepID=UPI0013CBB716|nr:hypothetical protein [Streptomyces sp. SID13031]NEA36414.1 hypothetical protein [Streptomyces sp. SID13031]
MVVQVPAEVLRGSFFRGTPGSITPLGEDVCEFRLSAGSPVLLIQYVAAVVALGIDYTLEASAEVAELMRTVGGRLASA